MISSIARSCDFNATVENELNRKVNVGTFGVACNLDSICQGAQGPMCPTRATIYLIHSRGERSMESRFAASAGNRHAKLT